MQEIVFDKPKKNHFYAVRKDNELLEVKNPIQGEKYLEIPVVSGG